MAIVEAIVATASESVVAAKEIAEVAEISEIVDLDEFAEVNLSEKGIFAQLDTIRFGNIETLATNNYKFLETINSKYEGTVHPETNVPFNRDIVILKDGTIIEGVFPEFNSFHDVILPENLQEAKYGEQIKYLNENLKEEIANNPELRDKFNKYDLEQIDAGDKPDGFTWHHHQETGRMQLVDQEIHSNTRHTGGMSIWGTGHS